MTDIESDLVEARRLSRLLVAAADQAKSRFSAAVEPFSLPVPLARTLLVLARPITMGELAEQLGVDPSYVTGLADQLQERGLIVRVPGSDRRVKLLQATEQGEVMRKQLFEAVSRNLTLTQRLDEAERRVLGELLERLLGEPDVE